jgi:hypothetical protein
MKKLVMMLMALCLTAVPATVNAQSKTVKKMVKAKMKDYKKTGAEIFGSSLTLEAALTKHYTKMEEQGDKVREIVGFSQAKSYNLAMNAAKNSAANQYANDCSLQIKGRVLADMALDVSENPTEFDKFYAAYEGKVEQEIRGELRPSFSVKRNNPDGTISVEAYYFVDEDAATKARIQAFKNAQTETEIAQKYAQRISDFVNERVTPQQ